MMVEFMQCIFKEFDVTDNRLMSYFLGIEVKQEEDRIFISQRKYIQDMLNKFKITDYKAVSTLVVTSILYKSLVGV